MIDRKQIIFSEHALLQIKYRRITQKQVRLCLKNSDITIRQSLQRYRVIQIVSRHTKNYLLVVVYDETPKDIIIVTAFLTSKLNKYL